MAKDTRSTTTKERAVRTAERATYRAPGSLEIPDSIKKHFKGLGYDLFWVRCIDPKTRMFDTSRVSSKMSIGGSVVTPTEIREVEPSFLQGGFSRFQFSDDFGFDEGDDRQQFTGIRKDDVVLMKIPSDWVEERQQHKNALAADSLAALPNKVRTDGGSVKKMEFGSAGVRVNKGDSFFEN